MQSWHSEEHVEHRESRYVKPKSYRPEPMNFIMYLHHEVYPKPPKTHRFLCGCGYTIFKANTNNIVISNDIGMPWEEWEPGSNLFEITCHNCKSNYKILFQ